MSSREVFVFGETREVAGYRLGRTLGKGVSGKVKLGYRLTDGYQVALKFIDRATLVGKQLEMLAREVAAMQLLGHPNILCLHQVEELVHYPRKAGKGTKPCVMLVLELSAGGELFDYLMHTGPFDEVLARTYFRALLAALELCHGKGVYHRDLKPENLLLSATFGLKLADFGLAAVSTDPATLCATECGTRSYMCPEVVAGRAYEGAKADVWSAGVVLFIMIAGSPPFQLAGGTDWWYRACLAGRHDRFWMAHLRTCPNFPPAAQEFLTTIFQVDPAQRASIDDLWDHPWMDGPTLNDAELAAAMYARHKVAAGAKAREAAEAAAKKAAVRGAAQVSK